MTIRTSWCGRIVFDNNMYCLLYAIFFCYTGFAFISDIHEISFCSLARV